MRENKNFNLQVNNMDNCDWCNLSDEDKQFQVYESKSWSVFLSAEQDYIGRCVYATKRMVESLTPNLLCNRTIYYRQNMSRFQSA